MHVAARHFLTIMMNTPLARNAGTQVHPKTRQLVPKHPANMADLDMHFDTAEWAKYGASLLVLTTWADVKDKVMDLIMESADSLILPSNRRHFVLVVHWHKGVMTGLWAMDMIRAVRRQRRFSAKIADLAQSGMAAVYHFHTEALVQYPKLLAMAAAS